VSSNAVVVDLEVDFHNEDETGYIWTWLSEARDPSMIGPERIVVVGDDDAIAMARVVDLIDRENGTIVHLEILPGTVAEYFEAVARARRHPRLTNLLLRVPGRSALAHDAPLWHGHGGTQCFQIVVELTP
jgi:hypothetical protein